MSDTATLDKADADGLDARERLRTAIAAFKGQDSRLGVLQAAATRAREQGWYAASRLSDAQAALREAMADESSRLAYAFLNAEAATESPITAAKAAVDAAQLESNRLDSTQAALSTEMENVKYQVRALQTKLHEAMMLVVINSAEYALLRQQHRDCWRKLRTVKEALRAVTNCLHGALGQELANEAEVNEPIQIRVGYPVGRELVDAWQDAMSALETDADYQLPLFG